MGPKIRDLVTEFTVSEGTRTPVRPRTLTTVGDGTVGPVLVTLLLGYLGPTEAPTPRPTLRSGIGQDLYTGNCTEETRSGPRDTRGLRLSVLTKSSVLHGG